MEPGAGDSTLIIGAFSSAVKKLQSNTVTSPILFSTVKERDMIEYGSNGAAGVTVKVYPSGMPAIDPKNPG